MGRLGHGAVAIASASGTEGPSLNTARDKTFLGAKLMFKGLYIHCLCTNEQEKNISQYFKIKSLSPANI
jgi:hypothetical protein